MGQNILIRIAGCRIIEMGYNGVHHIAERGIDPFGDLVMQDNPTTDSGSSGSSSEIVKPTRPPMLRHIMLIVVIAIVVWMGYSIGVNRGFWGEWKHTGASRAAPGSGTSTAPAAMPSR